MISKRFMLKESIIRIINFNSMSFEVYVDEHLNNNIFVILCNSAA